MKKVLLMVAVLAVMGASAAETWRVSEIAFESRGASGADVELDVVFSSADARLRIPAFWDGGRSYRVRFAPTREGVWKWRTECAAEKSLDGLTGELKVERYAGGLEIYRRGFVSAAPGRKYLAYADGTPFLYLGDTHWGFGREVEDDAAHPDEHHVETVAKRRVEQGFTVWQSEPLGCSFDLTDGTVDEADIAGFRNLDRGFQIVADHGFVHANAQFFFPRAMRKPLSSDEKALRRLSRYWVARYGAYPVMWTLGQEVDNDFYYGKGHGQTEWTAAENPYVRVATFIRSFDAYAHPLTAHQESTWDVSVTGRGTGAATSTNDLTRGRSAFADLASAKTCGHNWWGVQWSPRLDNGPQRFEVLRDFWEDPRPAVNYEGRYCGLWALDFGARAQVWISFLSGFCGQGYGAADLWLFKSTYDMAKPSKNEVESISLEVKHTPWRKALEFESANQMPHFRTFMSALPWWKLKPDFDTKAHFRPAAGIGGAYASAADGDGIVVVYVYDRTSTAAGTLCGLAAGADYRIESFNPRTGESRDIGLRPASSDGTIDLPDRGDRGDWAYRAVGAAGKRR